jgi:RHS repeat-associated protein
MEQVQIPALPDPLPVPIPLLKEKPRQGVPGKNPAPHPGHDLANSTVAIGLRAALHLDAIKSRYTGKERDTESGNDYFEARYYASSMGRFLSPDPIIQNDLRIVNPQRWNKYAYVINSPLILTDPTGKDAAFVNFNKMASGYGHSGLLSIHADGSATYMRYGPKTGGQFVGPGEVQTDHELPSVNFGADRLPTPASYAALIQAVADFENTSPATVGIDYFKTTESETTALDQFIQQAQDASDAGKAPTYCVIGSSCRNYTLTGLIAGGAVAQWRAPYLSIVPNTLFLQLGGLADQQLSASQGPAGKVTVTECDTLPDGTRRCQ